MRIITAEGGHGSFQFAADTGEIVMPAEPCDCEDCRNPGLHDSQWSYSNIARVDVGEWRERFPDMPMPEVLDVLDIGWFTKNGTYSGPVEEHRCFYEGWEPNWIEQTINTVDPGGRFKSDADALLWVVTKALSGSKAHHEMLAQLGVGGFAGQEAQS